MHRQCNIALDVSRHTQRSGVHKSRTPVLNAGVAFLLWKVNAWLFVGYENLSCFGKNNLPLGYALFTRVDESSPTNYDVYSNRVYLLEIVLL